MEEQKVYVVISTHGIADEVEEVLVGIYSNEEKANKAIEEEKAYYKRLAEMPEPPEDDDEFYSLWFNQQISATSYKGSYKVEYTVQ